MAALEATFTATPLFAPLFIPLALDKLASSVRHGTCRSHGLRRVAEHIFLRAKLHSRQACQLARQRVAQAGEAGCAVRPGSGCRALWGGCDAAAHRRPVARPACRAAGGRTFYRYVSCHVAQLLCTLHHHAGREGVDVFGGVLAGSDESVPGRTCLHLLTDSCRPLYAGALGGASADEVTEAAAASLQRCAVALGRC